MSKPYVVILHKISREKNQHKFYFSELQLYRPFTNENTLCPDSIDKCKALYDEISDHNGQRKVTNIKQILMEHLESVEDGTEKANDFLQSNAGALMDPVAEQDNAKCEKEVFEDHPQFAISDPGDLPGSSHETTSAL